MANDNKKNYTKSKPSNLSKRDGITFNFPATTFSQTNTVGEQLEHFTSEVDEVILSVLDNEPVERTDEELVDAFGSLETMLRVLIRTKGEQYVIDLVNRVEDKNRARDYYVEDCHEVEPVAGQNE